MRAEEVKCSQEVIKKIENVVFWERKFQKRGKLQFSFFCRKNISFVLWLVDDVEMIFALRKQ